MYIYIYILYQIYAYKINRFIVCSKLRLLNRIEDSKLSRDRDRRRTPSPSRGAGHTGDTGDTGDTLDRNWTQFVSEYIMLL